MSKRLARLMGILTVFIISACAYSYDGDVKAFQTKMRKEHPNTFYSAKLKIDVLGNFGDQLLVQLTISTKPLNKEERKVILEASQQQLQDQLMYELSDRQSRNKLASTQMQLVLKEEGSISIWKKQVKPNSDSEWKMVKQNELRTDG